MYDAVRKLWPKAMLSEISDEAPNNVVEDGHNVVECGDDNVVREDGENAGDVGDDSVVVEDGCDDNGGDEFRTDWYDDDFDTSTFLRQELFDEDYEFPGNDGDDEEVCYMSEGEAYDDLGPVLNDIGPIPEEPFETSDQLNELSEEEDDGKECTSAIKKKSTSGVEFNK
ncbi:hypothetical protein Leryth_018045, partial [Lithospermum erythrorhizon]